MKKVITLTALVALSTSAYAQSYIAGLDFATAPDITSDVSFDHGPQAGLFTLNIQTPTLASDGNPNGLVDDGWSAPLDSVVEQPGLNYGTASLNTLDLISGGATANTSEFGGTSAFAQGFSDTFAISFKANADGFFSISLSQAIDDFSISFDVAALSSEGQTAGSSDVNGNAVSVTDSFANQTVSLGNLSAGAITFDLTGLDSGATFDNFMISGTVVPEPSTYAAIFGVVALGFAAYRRRRS